MAQLDSTGLAILALGMFGFFFVLLPAALTVAEAVFLVGAVRGKERSWAPVADIIGIVLAIFGMILLLDLSNVRAEYEWYQEIGTQFFYTPVSNAHAPTVIVFSALSVISPLLLNLLKKKKLPPLLFVILIAGMYAGFAMDATVAFQLSRTTRTVMQNGREVYMRPGFAFYDVGIMNLIILLNILMMDVRTLLNTVRTYKMCTPEKKTYRSRFLNAAQDLLHRASLWPALALLLVLPLAGILIVILTLFGQTPDAAIKAFTETAEWRLSEMIPPQHIFYDEHYLCTVAAGGHKKIVKPLRKGIRHGHEVTVNRQLQVANAFEQILEERTPRFHRAVRGFYDKYGFPLSRHIRTKTAADVIYVLMKPLEWLFLLVLYMADARPEDRIAMQYTGKSAKDILENAQKADKTAPEC